MEDDKRCIICNELRTEPCKIHTYIEGCDDFYLEKTSEYDWYEKCKVKICRQCDKTRINEIKEEIRKNNAEKFNNKHSEFEFVLIYAIKNKEYGLRNKQ